MYTLIWRFPSLNIISFNSDMRMDLVKCLTITVSREDEPCWLVPCHNTPCQFSFLIMKC